MTIGALEIMGRGRADEPILGLDRPLREALAVYVARRWPTNRRKSIELEWDLTPDQARGVMEGTASPTTIDTVFKRGGWGVALPILGAVIGHGVGTYFAQEAERARDEVERAAEYERACRQAELVALRSFDPRLAGGHSDFPGGVSRAESPLVGRAESGRSQEPLTSAPGRRARR